MTLAQLNDLISAGCVFLPAAGGYSAGGSNWYVGGVTGFYMTATWGSNSLELDDYDHFVTDDDGANGFSPVRLVKSAN